MNLYNFKCTICLHLPVGHQNKSGFSNSTANLEADANAKNMTALAKAVGANQVSIDLFCEGNRVSLASTSTFNDEFIEPENHRCRGWTKQV